jgi:glycosyltransferase involved in cell wall biosynthesis
VASAFLGGPEKQILEHCRRLDPARWRAVIGSFRENRSEVALVRAARDLGVSSFLIDTRSPYSPRSVSQLRQALRGEGVRVLVTHGYKPNVVGALAARWTGLPHLPYYRGYTAETWKVRRYETLDRAFLRRARRVLCVSSASGDRLRGFGVDGSRIVCVPNAVAPAPRPLPLVDPRAEFSIPAGAPVAVAAGRLSAEKGHRFLVEALPRVPRLHAVVFGSGREREALGVRARTLAVSDRIHWAGFRDDVLPYLAAADVVVNPSLTEGLPNVVLEALSLAAPVVATDVGGVSTLVRDGETGWLVPPGDARALARALGAAIADREAAHRRGEAGRLLVGREFSFQIQAERLMGIYDGALDG